jgi:hypothetical protein
VKAEATERVAPDWDVLKRVALLALGCCAAAAAVSCGAARAAAEDSIKASGFGLRVAESLRRLGWPDDAVVFALATLPVIELRGAIPVGYWLRLHPVRLTILSVLGFVLFINPLHLWSCHLFWLMIVLLVLAHYMFDELLISQQAGIAPQILCNTNPNCCIYAFSETKVYN